jgi:cation diffusion facilitator CzcD-associated flavoprotein CzcO
MTNDRYVDVLIVGAGISGIDAAYHLQREFPERTFELVDRQHGFGGTWRTHKYPGIRSDSDLYTFGFSWKPWTGVPIATAEEILAYLDEAIDEQDIRRHIHYGKNVLHAEWQSSEKQWTVTIEDIDSGSRETVRCNFMWMCQGYYRHEKGYTPDFPGMADFKGDIVHPQEWPEALDFQGKKVVVIGSGATAATLIPAMASDCEHITMLQRSPTYFFARPNNNELADTLAPLDLPDKWIHEIMRRKYLHDQKTITYRSFDDPDGLRDALLNAARAYLGDDYPIDPHFTPRYRPWRQRLAVVPDGDLFKAIRAGKASVVTDQIESFTAEGILLKSGETLDADIIVTATGFNMCVLGDIDFVIDGRALDLSKSIGHRGIMFTGVPNLAWMFGYLRTSWTMRADLIAGFICRVFQHMDANDYRVVTPELRPEDADMPLLPFIDEENFNAGYLVRSMHLLPKQGDREPWVFSQDYHSEKDILPATDLLDGSLRYQ